MSHYLTEEEIKIKTAEINRLPEDPDYCISLAERIFVHEIEHYNR